MFALKGGDAVAFDDRQAGQEPRRSGRRDPRRRQILCAGFGGAGLPDALCEAVVEQGARLTVVANNAGTGRGGLAALLAAGRVRRIICSFPRSSGSVVFEEVYAAGRIELERRRRASSASGCAAPPPGSGVLLAGLGRNPARRGQGASRDRRPHAMCWKSR